VLSLHTGYDTAYLTDAAGGSDYYTGADGEPPGYWQGAGALALGLVGQVDAEVMRRLYHEDTGPDGQVLARRQRPGKYPEASGSLHQRIEREVAERIAEAAGIIRPEEIREIRLRLRAQWRNRVPFYDYTFSAPKSVSVLWASLLQAAAEAAAEGHEADAERLTEQAEQIRAAVKRANDRMMALAEQRAAYVRTGHHSATSGQWRDADGFIVASFPQHTNREGDPQLHVHNAIANRAQRADEADDKWRALHGQPLFKEKLGFSAYGDRFLAQELEQLGWLRTVRRADGNALEIGGISEEAADAFSDRAKELQDKARELAAEYTAKHGHAPGKQAWFKIKQQAALKTRDAKDHNPPEAGQELAAWARKAERRGAGKLSSLHGQVAAYAAERGPGEPPGETERARAIRIAVAEVQRQNAVWNRSQLVFELGRALGSLPPDVDPRAYLDELAAEATSGRAEGVTVLQVAPVPDVIDVSRLEHRNDGTSIYRPPGEDRFVTKEHLDHEQWLVDMAWMPVLQRVTAEAAEAAVAGTDLDWSQRAAVKGLLTSSRLMDCLVAPAGTGKTHVTAAFARAWTAQSGRRVIGLTASTNAARVMADEAAAAGAPMETANIAQFLGKIKDSDATRGHMPVHEGDVLVVDEATQVSTEDALRIAQIARRSGARVVGAFDPGQLGAVDAGGIFPLIAARHGSYELTEVRRFRHAWEADASLRLRGGDVAVLAQYAARGRVYHSHQARVYDDAVSRWAYDFRSGRDTLLLAASNEEAAELARLARERLAERHLISGADEITLADGNQAGGGDLVRARLNTRIDADGQTLANRDTIRIDGWQDGAFERLAVVSRRTGPGQWSRQFLVPAAYLEQSAELDYAGNVHVAQGRTVDTGHLVVSEGMTRDQLYVGMTRGRESNHMHVPTGPADPAQPTRAVREAYADAALARAHQLRLAGDDAAANAVKIRMPDLPSDRQTAPWEAVVAQVMQRDEPEVTALEAMKAAQDHVMHTGHLLELSEAYWRLDVVPEIDEMVRQRITPGEFERYMRDPERPAFLQVLREHEIGGRRIEDVLDAITAAPLDGLRSIAAGLHGRAGKEPAPVRGQTTGWAERAPRNAREPGREAARMLDTRQSDLGRQLAEQPEPWALDRWGAPPSWQESAARRADWEKHAGIVASYREAAGITDPAQAIGPVPAGQAQLREAFRASVVALELPDDQALLKAMRRGELEAQVQEYVRAEAVAPPDVQAKVGDVEHALAEARDRGEGAVVGGDVAALDSADAEAEGHSQELARLHVADAARREWAEAHADLEDQARAAARELRGRGLPEDRIPVTDAEVAETSAEERDMPALDADEWARLKAEQTTQAEADRQARREAAAHAVPVTDAEVTEAAASALEEPTINPDLWARWEAEHAAQIEADRQARAGEAARQVPVTDAEVAVAEAEPLEFPQVDPAQAAIWEAEQAVRDEAARQARTGEMGHRYPVTDAEVTASEATGRPTESPLIDPADAARWRAEQTARNEADRQVRKEASARAYPVTDAEIEKYGPPTALEPEAEPEPEAEAAEAQAQERDEIKVQRSDAEWRLDNAKRDAEQAAQHEAEPEAEPEPEPEPELTERDVSAEIHDDLAHCSRQIDELSARMEAEDARNAEAHEEILRQPPVWQAQAEPSLEASWQPRNASHYEADTEAEAELEI
jgi:conjugative relaxase-like TrwC/TraI family protein